MPQISPIPAIEYASAGSDRSALIAPPYDVLSLEDKQALLAAESHNIVAIDLPHMPPKTEGPAEVYQAAAKTLGQWLDQGVMTKRERPAVYVYRQTYTVGQTQYQRSGMIANVQVQPFGKSADGSGGVFPHEQTFSGPKQDRFNLMAETQTQLSPIFGLYSDPQNAVGPKLQAVIEQCEPSFYATTPGDGVLHEVWAVDEAQQVQALCDTLTGYDLFIADGHHRYNTAINYRQSLIDAQGELPAGHGADNCMFVLVAMQDPGMVVLPTHRVFGGMADFSLGKLAAASEGVLDIQEFKGSLTELEAALDKAAEVTGHAFGLCASTGEMAIAITRSGNPLAASHGHQSEAWRQLDVAILQYLIVEQICEPTFCGDGGKVDWRFPHTLDEVQVELADGVHQLAVIMRPTPLESVRLISEAGELMPQKSTFFYPKLATGLVLNPLGE